MWALPIIAGLVASCAPGDRAVVVVDSQRSAPGAVAESDSLPTVEELDATGGTGTTSGRFAGEPYAFTVDVTVPETGRDLSAKGSVDPDERTGMMEGLTIQQVGRGLDSDADLERFDPDLVLTQVVMGEDSYARGLIPELGYPDTIDPLAWYAAEPWVEELDELDLLGVTRSYDDVWALLAGAWTVPDEIGDVDAPMLTVTLGAEEVNSLRDTDSVFELAPYGAETTVIVEADWSGHVSAVSMSAESDEGWAEMRIEITDVGEDLVLPQVIDPTDPGDQPFDLDGPDDIDPDAPIIVPAPGDGVLVGPLRISTNGSYLVQGFVDVTYVIEEDGDVLRIVDGDIFTGPSGYTAWTIGPDGRRAVERLIVDAGLQGRYQDSNSGGGGVSGTILADGFVSFSVDHLEDIDGASGAVADARRSFVELIDRLDDLSDLGVAQTAPEPWVPSHLAVEVLDEYNPQYYTTDDLVWPLAQPIDDVAITTPDGERFVCLSGVDAAVVWHTLLIDGVNNARIPVTDGRTTREVGLRISYPGYHVSGNPCPPVSDVSGGSTLDTTTVPVAGAALPVDVADALLIPATELGPGWSGGGIESAGRPPTLTSCPGASDRSSGDAVTTFDRWMRRTLTLTGPGRTELLQLVGEATPGVDVDAVVDAIGPYADCDQPFTDFGISDFTSGDLPDLPARVTAGSYWAFTDRAGRSQLVADIAVDSRWVMVLNYSSPDSIELEEIDRFVRSVVERLDELEAAQASCAGAMDVPADRCAGMAS